MALKKERDAFQRIMLGVLGVAAMRRGDGA